MPQQRRYEDNAAKQRAYRARQVQARCAEQHVKGLPPAPPLPTLPSQRALAGAPHPGAAGPGNRTRRDASVL